MKKRLQGVSAGILIGAMLTSGVVFAKQVTEKISVIYDNIKILIDGKEYQPTNAKGETVEPFIYEGTTYLPVRAIANAFDKEVDWEAQTSTVILGSKNYDWLDEMGYVDYETSGNKNTLTAWESGAKANDGIKYDRGIQFFLGYAEDHGAMEENDGTLSSYQNVEYLLNNNYNTFSGKLVCQQGDQSAIIKVYGDGNLIYTSPTLTYGAKTVDFDINISDYKILKINASVPNVYYEYLDNSRIGIVEARLAKK